MTTQNRSQDPNNKPGKRIDPEQTDEAGVAPPKGRPDQQEFTDNTPRRRPGRRTPLTPDEPEKKG